MDFLDKRIQVICDELKKRTVKNRFPLTDWQYKEGFFDHPAKADASDTAYETFDSTKMHWYGPDRHYWFTREYTVPSEMAGKQLWLRISTQVDGWDARNPQFLLFINGEPMQGMDTNHRECLVSESANEGDSYRFDLQCYTGTEVDELRFLADILEIDPAIKALYYDLWVPLAAFNRMDKESPSRLTLERELNNTINLLDLREMYSETFYASLAKAQDYITEKVYTELAGHDDVIASCIGHTHIDIAWWWTVAQTREKVARSFATVLKLMDEYPDYKFMSSQAVLYYFLKDRYPELFEKIKERVAEKRWEPEGGMWVEADCNLTSGESLVRQFIHGKRFFREEFGVDNRILWLPDVFGYSGALPQIMKKSGIDYFMTTKLAWNQFNKIPHDSFMWRGIDGTEIFTHLITTLGIGQPETNFFTTYNGELHPDAIIGGWKRYSDKDINNDIMISYGFGDGGGGPTREMLETSSRMAKGVTGIPKARQVFSRTYFDELWDRVKDNKRLATWVGELYFEYHRGTYTSMARNKRSNRKSELGLMDLELLSVLTDNYDAEAIDKMWKTILINQFHDILPGTSIHEVYEVTREEYAEVAEMLDRLKSERLTALAKAGDNLVVFNTTGFPRNDVVALGDCTASAVRDADGNVWPVQITENGAVAYIENLPAKGWLTLEEASSETDVPFEVSDDHIETPFYSISFDENGLMTSVYDKDAKREVLQADAKANLFRMYEDKPIYYDNWDIDIFYTEKFWDVENVAQLEWTEVGPVRATLHVERRVSQSVIKQDIHFYAAKRRIDFVTEVDWKESQHLLKVHFPVNVHTDEATFDIQFGNLTRKTHTNTSWDKARFESCGQKWMDLSEGNYGVSLLNDCKYGHSVSDSNIALTLIKSGIEPNPTTDQEMHYFTYSLLPHTGGWRQASTVAESYFVNQPCYAVRGSADYFSLSSVDASNVVIETIKPAEDGDGIIVRVYESENSLTPARLRWARLFSSVEECNLVEESVGSVEVEGDEIIFSIKPYEVKSFRIR